MESSLSLSSASCSHYAIARRRQSLTRRTHHHQRVRHPSTMMDNLASYRMISGARELVPAFSSLSKRHPRGGQRWLTNRIHGGHSIMMHRFLTYCGHNFPHAEVTVLTLTLGVHLSLSRTTSCTVQYSAHPLHPDASLTVNGLKFCKLYYIF
jgi:hypothetical protein